MESISLPSFGEALRVWTRVALQSFGGPAGQIAVMHSILVEEKRWISEERFLHALSYCMLLPGPEAQQLATYVGWLLHRTRGGFAAGALFVLPGFVAILALSLIYAAYARVPLVEGVFFGIKSAGVVDAKTLGPMVLQVPDWPTLNLAAAAIASGAIVATFRFHVSMLPLIGSCALLGVVWRLGFAAQ